TSTRWPCTPVTRPAQSPSMSMRPSSARPSSAKNATAASRSSTTMPALPIRSTIKTTPKLVLETSPLRDAQPRSGAPRYARRSRATPPRLKDAGARHDGVAPFDERLQLRSDAVDFVGCRDAEGDQRVTHARERQQRQPLDVVVSPERLD